MPVTEAVPTASFHPAFRASVRGPAFDETAASGLHNVWVVAPKVRQSHSSEPIGFRRIPSVGVWPSVGMTQYDGCDDVIVFR
jgi:hypothetical protein